LLLCFKVLLKLEAISRHTKWLLTAAVPVVTLKTMKKWRNNKPPILQMAIERNYYITMHHPAGVHFENFTEVKFWDILITGTDV